MWAPRTLTGAGRHPHTARSHQHPAGLRVVIPPGSALCLRCRWTALAPDAAAEARRHTRVTAHPTIYRPVTPPQDDADETP